MVRKRFILWLTLFALLIVVLIRFDYAIIKAVVSVRTNLLTEIFMGITFVSSEIIIFIFLTSLFLWKEYKRRWIFPLWATLAASVIVSLLLKISVQRTRPYQFGIVETFPIFEKAAHVVWDYGFPSFQAMLAFCALPILAKEFPKIKYAWAGIAGLIAFSRLYLGLHFASDVVAGALIGYLMGMGIVKLEEEKGYGEKIVNKFFGKKK